MLEIKEDQIEILQELLDKTAEICAQNEADLDSPVAAQVFGVLQQCHTANRNNRLQDEQMAKMREMGPIGGMTPVNQYRPL